MILCELTDYSLGPIGTGSGIDKFDFRLSKGDVCSIHTDSSDDATLLIKALATIVFPNQGVYRFKGKQLNFSDYRKLLWCKKKIGYVTTDSAMMSNRTIRENFLFMRYYFENSLSIAIDEKTEKFCRDFGILDKLDTHASKIDRAILGIAITIRELSKSPEILLFDRPDDFISHAKFDLFMQILSEIVVTKVPVVFFSHNTEFIEIFSNRKISIFNKDFKMV